MKALCLLFALLPLGCAQLSGQRAIDHSSDIQVRDVAYKARGEDQAPRHRVLVLPFLTEKLNDSDRIAGLARQAVVKELMRTGQFVVVPMSDFPQDPKTFLNEKHEYDLSKISQAASTMGIAAVIEGKVVDIHANKMGDSLGLIRDLKANVSAEVRVRVYAAHNGKEILNETHSAETGTESMHIGPSGDVALSDNPMLVRSAIRKAFMGSVDGIVRAVEKLNWEGRVALVAGDRIYVNAGRLSGLQIGDILKVTEKGQDVYDPDTGRFIGTAPGRLKGTIEVVSYFGKDGAIAVIHSGSGFQQNDRVELY